jgi:hypothetical protein
VECVLHGAHEIRGDWLEPGKGEEGVCRRGKSEGETDSRGFWEVRVYFEVCGASLLVNKRDGAVVRKVLVRMHIGW